MKDLVAYAISDKSIELKERLNERLKELVDEKLNQLKMRLAQEMFGDVGVEVDFVEEELSEANITKMGRAKIIRVRIRNGKVQRRKKVSAVKGYTIRQGKMVRMSSQERMHRKMAARRSKFKRRAKLRQSLRKRKISLRRRHAMGL